MLLVDEAHATGVFRARGRGVAEWLGVDQRIPVRIGTLSKSFGSIGGFVAGSRLLVDWLTSTARPYIFSTAMPAAACTASMAAIEIAGKEPQRREGLLARPRCSARLAEQGWNLGRSASQIIPLVVGQSERALKLASELRDAELLVPAIRPPTVPAGEACLRISLTCGHSDEAIDRLVEALGACGAMRDQTWATSVGGRGLFGLALVKAGSAKPIPLGSRQMAASTAVRERSRDRIPDQVFDHGGIGGWKRVVRQVGNRHPAKGRQRGMCGVGRLGSEEMQARRDRAGVLVFDSGTRSPIRTAMPVSSRHSRPAAASGGSPGWTFPAREFPKPLERAPIGRIPMSTQLFWRTTATAIVVGGESCMAAVVTGE